MQKSKSVQLVEILYKDDELINLFHALISKGLCVIQEVTPTLEDGYDGVVTVATTCESDVKKIVDEHNKLMLQFDKVFLSQDSNVLRPAYYNQDDPYEVIKVIRAWKLDFELGNAVKYIARAGKKNPEKEIEDLEKAKTYLDMKIAHLKSQKNGAEG